MKLTNVEKDIKKCTINKLFDDIFLKLRNMFDYEECQLIDIIDDKILERYLMLRICFSKIYYVKMKFIPYNKEKLTRVNNTYNKIEVTIKNVDSGFSIIEEFTLDELFNSAKIKSPIKKIYFELDQDNIIKFYSDVEGEGTNFLSFMCKQYDITLDCNEIEINDMVLDNLKSVIAKKIKFFLK